MIKLLTEYWIIDHNNIDILIDEQICLYKIN